MSVEFISPPAFDLNDEHPPVNIQLSVHESVIINKPFQNSALRGENYIYTDPGSWSNLNKSNLAKIILPKAGWLRVSVVTFNKEQPLVTINLPNSFASLSQKLNVLKRQTSFHFFQNERLVLFDPEKVHEAMSNYNKRKGI